MCSESKTFRPCLKIQSFDSFVISVMQWLCSKFRENELRPTFFQKITIHPGNLFTVFAVEKTIYRKPFLS